MRIQYAARLLLTSIYLSLNDNENALSSAINLSSECSPNGWYYDINRYVGEICAQNNDWISAVNQYDLALKGLYKKVEDDILRYTKLEAEGEAFRPDNSVSWEQVVNKAYEATIENYDSLLQDAKSHLTSFIPENNDNSYVHETKVFYNWTNQTLNLEIRENINSTCFLYSASGQLLQTQKLHIGDNSINVKSLKTGLYIIKILNNKNIIIQKLVKK